MNSETNRHDTKKLVLCSFLTIVIIIALLALTSTFSKPSKSVQELIEEGNYIEAYEILEKARTVESLELREAIFEDYKREKLEKAEVGDTIVTGYYLTDMEWKVLDKQDGKLFVIAEGLSDYKCYNDVEEPATWETCSLRKWLNEEFIYSNLFSPSDRDRIVTTKVNNNDNTAYDFNTEGGNSTYDRVYLMSIEEAEKYYSQNQDRIFYINKKKGDVARNTTPWWLRSPGSDNMSAAIVTPDGQIYEEGYDYKDSAAVRPVMWIQQ